MRKCESALLVSRALSPEKARERARVRERSPRFTHSLASSPGSPSARTTTSTGSSSWRACSSSRPRGSPLYLLSNKYYFRKSEKPKSKTSQTLLRRHVVLLSTISVDRVQVSSSLSLHLLLVRGHFHKLWSAWKHSSHFRWMGMTKFRWVNDLSMEMTEQP